jgi:hypothetical protein
VSGAIDSGPYLLYENGAAFLFLRGDCRYWVLAELVLAGTFAFGETREGVLEPGAEAQLHDDLRYDDWPDQVGIYGTPPGEGGGPSMLSDLTHEIGCYYDGCQSNPNPSAAAVGALFSAAWDWASRLHQQGSPLTGPVRALAVEGAFSHPGYAGQILPWTVGVSLSSLVLDPRVTGVGPGRGRLVAQPDAEVLREWRNNQLAGSYHPASDGPFIAVSDNGGPFFALYVRDALPFEGENGLVPF